MSSPKQTKDEVDTSGWLTCAAASDLAHCSENTIRNWVRHDKLHPRRALRAVGARPDGPVREVDVYDPSEISVMAAALKKASAPPVGPGEVAARAFELFDRGTPIRRVVVELREVPAKVEELHEQWLDCGGSEIVVAGAAREELERLLGPFADVADLVSRATAALARDVEVTVEEGTPLATATDAQVERAVLAVIEPGRGVGEAGAAP